MHDHISQKSKHIRVLMYHRIVQDGPGRDRLWTNVGVRDFRKQLRLLDNLGFTPITLHDYGQCVEGELQLPKKPIVITFDDGYRDTYELAFRALQDYGMRAVVFVLGNRRLRSNVWDHNGGMEETELVSDEQILEMHEAGFEIGAHSCNHVKLTQMDSLVAADEIMKARMSLEMLLNSRVTSFSYPYGLVNEEVKRMVIKTGYRFACAVYSGPPRFCQDPYEIRRLTVRGDDLLTQFALKLILPYTYLEWAYWRLRTSFQRTARP